MSKPSNMANGVRPTAPDSRFDDITRPYILRAIKAIVARPGFHTETSLRNMVKTPATIPIADILQLALRTGFVKKVGANFLPTRDGLLAHGNEEQRREALSVRPSEINDV